MSTRVRPFPAAAGSCIELPAFGASPGGVHVIDDDSVQAIQVARAANRPLLVSGEPGTGKSQLARAAAAALGVPLVSHVVTGHTRAQDLMWRYDAVGRLGRAQLLGALRDIGSSREQLHELHEGNFVTPGPLWFAFDWGSASAVAKKCRDGEGMRSELEAWLESERNHLDTGWSPEKGCVLLIDEIDKAEADVPNGMLECLGDGRFSPLGHPEVHARATEVRLVIITTNQERALPNAFVRRCVVLKLGLPALPRPDEPLDDSDIYAYLLTRARAHFRETSVSDEVIGAAIRLLIRDRQAAIQRQAFVPGLAEFLDLLRALTNLAEGDTKAQLILLKACSKFTFEKEPSATPLGSPEDGYVD